MLAQVAFGVGAVKVVGVHFHVGEKLLEGVGGARVTTKKHRGRHIAQLGLHAQFGPPLLDQRLEVLAHCVGRGQVLDFKLHAIFDTNAVWARLPAGLVQQGFGTCHVLLDAVGVVGGKRRRCRHQVAGRATRRAVSDLDQGVAVNRHGQRLAHPDVCQEWVGVLGGRTQVAMLGRGVGQVHFDALNQRAEGRNRLALAAPGHARQHVGCELQVPGVVKLTRFHDCAACSCCIATTLEGHRGKGGLGGIAVVGVGDQLRHVVRAEFLHREGTGADWAEVLFGAGGCFVTQAVFELRTLQDRGGGAAKHVVGVGLGRLEGDAHREVIGRDDFVNGREGVGLGATLDAGAVLVGKDHVLCGQG